MNRLIIYFILTGLTLFVSCSSEQHRNAYLRCLADTLATGTDEQVEGLQAGGIGRINRKKVIWNNASCTFDSALQQLVICFTDTGYIEATPGILQLPADWQKYKWIAFKISNPNPFAVVLNLQIHGARNILFRKETLSAESKQTLKMSLIDLPLTGRNIQLYQPHAIRIAAENDSGTYTILLNGISLIQTADTMPRAVVDQFGQRIHAEWPGKIKSGKDLKKNFDAEQKKMLQFMPPKDLDRFGGWTGGERYAATGFFRVQKIGDQWWFITPDGYPFWSLGVTGVRSKYTHADVTIVKGREYLFEALAPAAHFRHAYEGDSCFSFYSWNIFRKYGSIENWQKHTLLRLNRWGINTLGNWSEISILRIAKMPFTHSYRTSENNSFRLGKNICDYFNEGWLHYIDSVFRDAAEFKDNPYLIGYFIDNEAGWDNPDLLDIAPADAALRNKWIQMIRKKYSTLHALNKKWDSHYNSWDSVRLIKMLDHPGFKNDYLEFEKLFVEQYFRAVTTTLKKYDPNHLYLGCRFTRRPKPVHIMQIAGKYSDVVSVNCYSLVPQRDEFDQWYKATQKPILIGEHHLPLQSSRQLPPKYQAFTPADRFVYYQRYVEIWAQIPYSVGSHWYQYVDQHITGRASDGENQTVGLVDITDQPYEEMIHAISSVSRKIYSLHNAAQ